MIGQTIFHYKVLEKLGEGGMGVVYKAEDTTLKRTVALKFLPSHLSASDQDKARFMQEAQAAASLNHPNICTIYGIDEHEGQMFFAMEFVDGQTLREKMSSLSSKQAIDLAIQIADGLAGAHEKGIVHRDIKPENIMVRKDGICQVMDFGLAKLRASGSKISRLTKVGSTVGTAGYMSPEQVQGQDTDHRSDIFSYGVLLYEMLTGHLPFKGVHETALAYEIVNVDPAPMSAVKPEIDPNLDAIVLECLEKDINERAQGIKQISVDLKRYKRESSRQRASHVTVARPMDQSRQMVPGQIQSTKTFGREVGREAQVFTGQLWKWGAMLFFVGMIIFAAMYFVRPPMDKTIVRSSLLPPENVDYSSYQGGGQITLSHDGTKLAFLATDSSGKNRLWVRPLNSLTALPLPGTEGASFPFWSPDNRFIAFFASAKMKKIEAAGGPLTTICNVGDARGGTWSQDGIIVFAPNWIGGLYQVSAAGGVPAAVTKPDTSRREQTHRWPSFLPDGKHFLYFSRSSAGGTEKEEDAIYVASLDGTASTRLFTASSNVAYASGHILFVRQSAVMAQAFNPDNRTLVAEAFPMAEQVGYDVNFNRGWFTVSDNGVFVYQTGGLITGNHLLWFDRTGKQLETIGESAMYGGGQLSRDEKKLAISVFDAQSRNRDIWISDLKRGIRTKFTFDQGVEDYPIWSLDGSRVIYCSDKKGHLDIYQKALNGTIAEELLFESASDKYPTDLSSDGRFLLYYSSGDKTTTDLWVLPLGGERKPISIAQTEFEEVDAQFSPDGRWISYVSNESGRYEVYVRSFTTDQNSSTGAVRGGKWQISTAGVAGLTIAAARWRGDGKELYYWSEDQKLMAAEINATNSSFEVGTVRQLFDMQSRGATYVAAVSADGKRFLVASAVGEISTPLTLVLNWDEELKKK